MLFTHNVASVKKIEMKLRTNFTRIQKPIYQPKIEYKTANYFPHSEYVDIIKSYM